MIKKTVYNFIIVISKMLLIFFLLLTQIVIGSPFHHKNQMKSGVEQEIRPS